MDAIPDPNFIPPEYTDDLIQEFGVDSRCKALVKYIAPALKLAVPGFL